MSDLDLSWANMSDDDFERAERGEEVQAPVKAEPVFKSEVEELKYKLEQAQSEAFEVPKTTSNAFAYATPAQRLHAMPQGEQERILAIANAGVLEARQFQSVAELTDELKEESFTMDASRHHRIMAELTEPEKAGVMKNTRLKQGHQESRSKLSRQLDRDATNRLNDQFFG